MKVIRLCTKEAMHSNTGVPSVCSDCSDAFGICIWCMADLEMRERSKFDRKAKRKKAARGPKD